VCGHSAITKPQESAMSIRSSIVKLLIKLTPSALIIWASNFILKGIAELSEFDFNVDARKIHVKTTLYGEQESIDIVLEDFAMFHDGESYRFIIHHANSDRSWLNNLLAKMIGKAWKIPELPQFAWQLEMIAELFKANPPALANDE
jgi:hypothetical protein